MTAESLSSYVYGTAYETAWLAKLVAPSGDNRTYDQRQSWVFLSKDSRPGTHIVTVVKWWIPRKRWRNLSLWCRQVIVRHTSTLCTCRRDLAAAALDGMAWHRTAHSDPPTCRLLSTLHVSAINSLLVSSTQAARQLHWLRDVKLVAQRGSYGVN